jgi:hypothetical protein
MRKPMWAVQLGNKNILNYEYSDCDLKVALFRTKSRAQAWLDDNPFWRSRSAKVVKVVVKIETTF